MGGGKGGAPSNFNQIVMQQQQMAMQNQMQQQQLDQMEKVRVENNTQVSKNITETTSAARQAQKEKAAKASGIRGSVYTDSSVSSGSNRVENKTMLGK